MALLQLTPEEGDAYRDCPVYLNFHTGFYMFPVSAHSHESLLASGEADAPRVHAHAHAHAPAPCAPQPNHENIMKLAIHDGGYTQPRKCARTEDVVSTPRTVLSHGADGLRIPKAALQKLRAELHQVYPELAKKPFAGTRLCW